MVQSEFGVNEIKEWITNAVCQGFSLAVVG